MSANIFNSIRVPKVGTNVFDLSHDVKMSLNMGQLVPVFWEEAVPGDTFHITPEVLLRFSPMLSPVMHKIDVIIHTFFVPNRIIWPNWEKFITSQDDDAPSAPYLSDTTVDPGMLADYLGLLTGESIDMASALPFAAYQKIYNEYYRDLYRDWET